MSEVGSEVPVPGIKELERKELPNDPEKMTFRGRYEHVDRKILDLIGIQDLNKGETIRVLDFAGGVLNFGSPTAHDLSDKITEAGLKAEIDVVDKFLPPDLKPSYFSVGYHDNLDSAQGTYDIIRSLRVLEWIDYEEYEKIRVHLLDHLKEGGIFVTNQYVKKIKTYSDFTTSSSAGTPMVIKIMQKREGSLVPIALLPDAIVPQPPGTSGTSKEYMQKYNEMREKAKKGEIDLAGRLDEEGFQETVEYLKQFKMPTLDSDQLGVYKFMSSPWEAQAEKGDNSNLMETLDDNSKETALYFRKEKSSVDTKIVSKNRSNNQTGRSFIQKILRR